MSDISIKEREESLDVLEGLVRLHVHTDDRTKQTSASALWDEADALRMLAKHGRFRITGGAGSRLVCGYWPEHDPRGKDAVQ